MLLMLWVLTSILSIWLERFLISFYSILRSINLWKTFLLCIVRVIIRKTSSINLKSAERLLQQVICNSFWRQFLTRSLNLHDLSTTFYKSNTSFVRYLTILIDVSWTFWSSKTSNLSKLESAILLIHLNESTTLFRFKTSWINFVLILNAFVIRKSFKLFWLNLKR